MQDGNKGRGVIVAQIAGIDAQEGAGGGIAAQVSRRSTLCSIDGSLEKGLDRAAPDCCGGDASEPAPEARTTLATFSLVKARLGLRPL